LPAPRSCVLEIAFDGIYVMNRDGSGVVRLGVGWVGYDPAWQRLPR
jgi:hypothetical protein